MRLLRDHPVKLAHAHMELIREIPSRGRIPVLRGYPENAPRPGIACVCRASVLTDFRAAPPEIRKAQDFGL